MPKAKCAYATAGCDDAATADDVLPRWPLVEVHEFTLTANNFACLTFKRFSFVCDAALSAHELNFELHSILLYCGYA
ncbi:unnamed protein product, partial [Iphiclides podalirius]